MLPSRINFGAPEERDGAVANVIVGCSGRVRNPSAEGEGVVCAPRLGTPVLLVGRSAKARSGGSK